MPQRNIPIFIAKILMIVGKLASAAIKMNTTNLNRQWLVLPREILFENGRYGIVREIFRTGMDGTGSPGIPVPFRTVREISRTVATLAMVDL
jgi:hypothetical protein